MSSSHPDQPLAGADASDDRRPSLAALLREDFRTHGSTFASPAFRALAAYRLLVWRQTVRPRLLQRIVGVPIILLWRRVRNRHGIELPLSARIGRRVRLSDLGDICLGAKVVGDDCVIGHGVTIGRVNAKVVASPAIGRGVTIGPGAVVVGDLAVGDDAVIEPGAVVVARVPAGGVVKCGVARAVGTIEPPPDASPPNATGAGGLWALIREDRAAHGSWLAPGFHALAAYRLRRHARGGAGAAARSVDVVGRVVGALVRSRHRIVLDPEASIGHRVRLADDGRIIVARGARIGDDCTLDARVMIGWRPARATPPMPGARLGSGVRVASGVLVADGSDVGGGARIGFNAVVDSHLPGNTSIGPPAVKVLRLPKVAVS